MNTEFLASGEKVRPKKHKWDPPTPPEKPKLMEHLFTSVDKLGESSR